MPTSLSQTAMIMRKQRLGSLSKMQEVECKFLVHQFPGSKSMSLQPLRAAGGMQYLSGNS